MSFRTYAITLTGAMPLLLHNDHLEWSAALTAWRTDPENKAKSVPGDDRTPAWTWIGSLYHDAGKVGIPSDNLMTALREGGARVSVPGKRSLTYKRQSQSGLVVNELLWPVIGSKGPIAYADIEPLLHEEAFEAQSAAALRLGFELFAKRARIGTGKHVRVRPKFAAWSASGTITVFDETITTQVLDHILTAAGRFCGIGDWRPSSPKSPGPYGTFTAAIQEVK